MIQLSQMNVLTFFAALLFLTILNGVIAALVLRFLVAFIDKRINTIQELAQEKISGLFLPAAQGEQSEFGKIIDAAAIQIGNTLADTTMKKFKMAELGHAGGISPKHFKITGNKLIDGLLQSRIAGYTQAIEPNNGQAVEAGRPNESKKLGF